MPIEHGDLVMLCMVSIGDADADANADADAGVLADVVANTPAGSTAASGGRVAAVASATKILAWIPSRIMPL
jgi:hypothetical protein